MPHMTIEYVIMVPMMVLQIFLFPLTANWLMNIWVDSRRTLALQDVAGQLASTMQQLYFSLNHETIPAGKVTHSPRLPPFIENLHYIANGTLRPLTADVVNSTKMIDLMVRLIGAKNSVNTAVILGPNVNWYDSAFISNSTYASIAAEKFPNGTISLRFEG